MATDQHLALRAAPIKREQRACRRLLRLKCMHGTIDQPRERGRDQRAPAAKTEISHETYGIDHAAAEELVGPPHESVLAQEAVRVGGIQDAGEASLRCAGNEHPGSLSLHLESVQQCQSEATFCRTDRWAIATGSGTAADRPLAGKSVRWWIPSETSTSSA